MSDQALRIHQEQILKVLQAEQDLISLQKRKHALENGQDWPTQQHAPAHEEQCHGHKEEESIVSELQVQVPEIPHSFHLHKLVIELVEARNLSVLDNLLNKLDPYILLNLGKERHQTPTFKNAGANPNFNHFQVHCPITNDIDCIQFEVWDKHKYLSDTILGRGQLFIHDTGLRHGQTCDTWVPLFKDGFKPAGEVHVVLIPHS